MTPSTKRVALVTGASSGLGKDFALRLLAEGYAVYGAARRIERMRDIEAAGGVALTMDVTDDDTMIVAINRMISEQSRIDVLINNAGYGQMGALEDVPIEEGRRQMEVNLVGAARLTQLALPYMRSQKSGKIVNVSSIGGKIAIPLGGWYHASKFALKGYSDALRMEVRPFGIHVIVIEPGGTDTEWVRLRWRKRNAIQRTVLMLSSWKPCSIPQQCNVRCQRRKLSQICSSKRFVPNGRGLATTLAPWLVQCSFSSVCYQTVYLIA